MNLLIFPTIWGIKAAGTFTGKALLAGEAMLGGDMALEINQTLTFG